MNEAGKDHLFPIPSRKIIKIIRNFASFIRNQTKL